MGISFLEDASVCLVEDGRLRYAISQERLNRIKLWSGVPSSAIEHVLRSNGLNIHQIDAIATHGTRKTEPSWSDFENKRLAIKEAKLSDIERNFQIDALYARWRKEKEVFGKRTPNFLAEIESLGRPTYVYEHHACHAATAFFGSGWPELLTVTADGWGEDGSASFWRFDRGQFVRESSTPTIDSLGYFYGSITAALGFTPHRHEGKVLGLAAAGKENKKLEQLMGQLVSYDKNRQVFLGLMELGVYQPSFDNPILTQILGQYAREDVARAAQSRLERVVSEAVLSLVKGPTRVGLAGGIFSNVKLNQIVSELPSVAEVFVFPSMGDGGLSIGAAWLAYSEISGQRPEPLTTALLGPTYSHREILGAIEYTGLDYSYQPQISAVIAQLLAEGHPVVRVNGRMEFGPRALGNRSVLAPATDTSVVEYLNDRLGRSEFMPFAPACLGESMDDQFVRPFDRQHMTRYMTTTLDSRDVLQKQSPASVHLDGTARPQSVFASDYPQLHEVLTRYRELTGIPVAINTSFNMHEEPIVCDPPSALATFVTSRLPYMAFGNFLISNR